MSSPYPPANPYGAPPANPYGPPAAPHDAPPANPYGAPPAAPVPPQPSPYGQPPQPAPAGYGYPAAPAAPQPAPGYGYPAAPAQPGPYDQPGAAFGQPAPGGPGCRFCGGMPAVDATVRGHRGMIIIMTFLKQQGPFCRTCGLAVLRDMSAKTLVQGWWGYFSSVITPITLLRNIGVYNKLKTLPAPAPGTHGPQLNPGKPLTQRPAIFMLLLPVLSWGFVITVFVVAALAPNHTPEPYHYTPSSGYSSSPYPSHSFAPNPSASAGGSGGGGAIGGGASLAKTGDCLHNGGTDSSPRIDIVPCSDTNAEYKVLGRVSGTTDAKTACGSKYPDYDSDFVHSQSGTSGDWVLCLKDLKPAPAASS